MTYPSPTLVQHGHNDGEVSLAQGVIEESDAQVTLPTYPGCLLPALFNR